MNPAPVRRLAVLAMLFLLGASIAAGQVTLSLPDTAVANGTSLSVPVKVTGFYHIGAVSIKVSFDKTVLTYTGLSGQPAFGIFNSTSVSTANANGSVSISWFNVTPALNIGSATFVNLNFTLSSGTSALTFTDMIPSSIADSLGNNLPYTYTNGRVSGPPGTPTLISPANAATGVSTTPTLTWNKLLAAKTYRVQLATDSNFGSTVLNDSTVTDTTRQVGPLSGSTTYYWRVSATNASGTSAYPTASSFSTIAAAPAPPMLASPSNGATNQATNVTLSWSASPGATSYRLQVSTDQNFATTVYDQSGLTGTSQAMSGLLTGTTYYWRVNATNANGTSAYSSVRSFATSAATPAAPTLSSPANVATNQATNVTLSWNASTGAASYRLQVSTDQNFGTTFYDQSGLTGTSQAMSSVSPNTTYYWRVNATNASGTSAYSTAWSFTTGATTLLAPVLVSPSNAATNQPTTVTLSWNAVTGATGYRVQVSTSPTFSTTVLDDSTITGLTREVGPLSNSTTYYWRVSGSNASGIGPYSAAWSFTTTAPAPSAPTLSSPANAATNQASNVTLSWNASTGAVSYRLQVSTDQNFATTVYDQLGLTQTSQAMSGLSNSTTYYWRVSAWNAGGTSPYSAVWSFTTGSGAPEQLTVSMPDTVAVVLSSVTLPVRVTGFYHVGSFSLNIAFNKNVLTYTGYANQPPFGIFNITSTSTANANGSIGISWFNITPALNIGSETLLNLAFTYKGGTDTLKFTNTIPSSITDSLGANMIATYTNGRVRDASTVTPAPPALLLPASGAANQATNVALSWSSSVGAISYRLQVSTDQAFGSTFFDQSGLTGTSQAMTGLLNNTTYYWRVNATNAAGTSAYSSVRSFTTIAVPPPSPTLLLPANTATGIPVTTTLSWNASTGAASYRVQVSTAQDFSSTVLDDSLLTGTSRQVGPLSNNTTYYWRVSAKNVGGSSAFSAAWSFTTIVAAPAAPVLTQPANAATGVPVTSTLSWNASTGATSYRVQVSTAQDFSSTVLDDSLLTGTSRQVGPLSNNTTYYWQVRAKNAGGSSAFSAAWSFTTIVGAPAIPTLLQPANAATGVPVTSTLSWNASTGATSYRVQVSTAQDFSSTVLDDSLVTGTSRQVGPLSNNTTYYWRVSAKNAGGSSAFSAAWSFTTIVALPAIPVPNVPADTAINLPLNTTLSWNAAGGATAYHLQVSISSAFTPNIVDDTTITATSKAIGPLNLATTYYWRVRSKNAAGYSAFSAARSFKTIRTTAVERLEGAVPTDYVLSQNYPNPFNPSTTIQYDIPASGFVSLKVYNVLGEAIVDLVGQHQEPGRYVVRLNAESLPSGMYLYQLRTGSFVQTKRMILMK